MQYEPMEEFWDIVNNESECDYIYGGNRFVITDEDIEALKRGKIINFSVNMEYGCTLRYENVSRETSERG